MFKVPERFRVTTGFFGSTVESGNNGHFEVKLARNQTLRVFASDKLGWEHVSVSRQDRCPTWEEMNAIKDLFWDHEDTVMQLHPPKSAWVTNHNFCLHLWRPTDAEIPRPPDIFVGVAGLGTLK